VTDSPATGLSPPPAMHATTIPTAAGRPDSRYGSGGYYNHANPHLEVLAEARHRRILDVGCGTGALGRRLRQSRPDREVWGIERDHVAAQLASTHLDRVLQLDLDELDALPEDAGRFDLVVLGDLVEHLREPARLLRALLPVLAPAGEVVASVPNVAHWSVIAELLAGRFTYQDAGLLDRTHIHLFTPSSFRTLLTEVGLGTVTKEVRITLPSALSHTLAQLGVALAGAAVDQDELHQDFDTYQTIFRARPPVDGSSTGLVVAAEGGGDTDARRAVASYLAGFRRGEAVRLVVAVPAAGGGAGEVETLVESALATLDVPPPAELQPEVEAVTWDPGKALADQLPAGSARHVAVGPAAWRALPGMTRADDDRFSLLEAARTA
jgi:SAM-dependent methyltransferase